MALRIAIVALVSALLPACAGGEPSVQDFHWIEGGFSRGMGPDGNTGIFDSPDGLVVIDTGRHPGHAQAILDYAKAKGRPIAIIVNTHWHLDHTTGNTDIKAAFPRAKVYATDAIDDALAGFLARSAEASETLLATRSDLAEKDRAEIERGLRTIREPDALRPDIVVDGPIKIKVNGRALELHVTDHAATASDIWIFDPATKTAIIGDLVTFPAPFLDTGCSPGWLAAFEAIEKTDYRRVAPGHGKMMTPAEFRRYQAAFRAFAACAAEEPGEACAEKWLADAGALMSESDRAQAPAYAAYYAGLLKSAAHQAEFCSAP